MPWVCVTACSSTMPPKCHAVCFDHVPWLKITGCLKKKHTICEHVLWMFPVALQTKRRRHLLTYFQQLFNIFLTAHSKHCPIRFNCPLINTLSIAVCRCTTLNTLQILVQRTSCGVGGCCNAVSQYGFQLTVWLTEQIALCLLTFDLVYWRQTGAALWRI